MTAKAKIILPKAVPSSCDILFLIILHEEWNCFLNEFPEVADNVKCETLGERLIEKASFRYGKYDCVAACLNPDEHAAKEQGKVPASVLTARLVEDHLPKIIVNVGIAGRIHDDVCIGGVVYVTSVSDATGNSAAEAQDNARGFVHTRGNQDISCDEEILKRLVAFRKEHRDVFNLWKESCATALRNAKCESKGLLQKDGILASGDPVGKSDDFKKNLKRFINRNALCYEMEGYAIAQAAKMGAKCRLVIIKGLSDNTNEKKNQEEQATSGGWREVAAKNAFGLLKLVLREEVIGGIENQSPVPPPIGGARSHSVEIRNGNQRKSFPFFQEHEIIRPSQVAQALLRPNGERLNQLVSIVRARIPSAEVMLKRARTQKGVARYLNEAIDSNLMQKGAYWVPEYTRAHKVWLDAIRQQEHAAEIANRVVIEELLFSARVLPVKHKTPILTCLVEDTDHSHAMEEFKDEFQKRHSVVIDFDAKPLAQLYTISDNELIIDKTTKYDIFFHYHLGINKLFSHGVLPTLQDIIPDVARRKALIEEIMPNVAAECCKALGRNGEGEQVCVPVNANSMVLLYNRRMFKEYEEIFRASRKNTARLDPPQSWGEFTEILRFFQGQQKAGIVLQQKRESDSLYFEWCNFAYSYREGGGVLEKEYGWQNWEPNQIKLASKATIEATEYYSRLTEFHPKDGPPPKDCDAKIQLERFAKGDVAMAIVWSDMLYKFFQLKEHQDKFGVVPIPGNKSMVGGGVVCINRKSKHTQIATDFVRDLLTRKSQIALMQSGWCSGYKNVYGSARVRSLAYADAVQKSLQRACYMIEAGPRAHRVRELVGRRLEEILAQPDNVTFILRQAEEELREEFFS